MIYWKKSSFVCTIFILPPMCRFHNHQLFIECCVVYTTWMPVVLKQIILLKGITMNQRIMLTKRLLKESLLKLLKETDIFHITVKELCANSGINRSTFYNHYTNPQDVLFEIEQEAAAAILEHIRNTEKNEDLYMNLLTVCEYIYANRETQRIIMQNNTVEDMTKVLFYPAFEFQIPEIYLSKKINQNPIDIQLACIFLSSGIYNALKKWIIDDIAKSPEEIASILYHMISRQLP